MSPFIPRLPVIPTLPVIPRFPTTFTFPFKLEGLLTVNAPPRVDAPSTTSVP